MQNRPWNIWWDFAWAEDGSMMEGVNIETDHPNFKDGYLYHYSLDDVADDRGYIDNWVDVTFYLMRDELMSGRVSINKIPQGFFESYKIKKD